MRLFFAVLIAAAVIPVMSGSDVSAQATCRQKCTDEEQACLKRTGNKSQCGDRAKTCIGKCK